MEIKGHYAVVTGGGSGMGAETARSLARAGARVAIIDNNEEHAKAVAKEIQGAYFLCDVSEAQSTEKAFNNIINDIGVPRICINCAGIAPAKRMVGREGPLPLEEFSRVIQINLIGTFNVMRLAAAHMQTLEPVNDSGERGIIINTASVAAYEGQIGQAAYSASKGGVVALTLPTARELAQFGIRVNAIAPGLIATPMLLTMPQEVQTSLANMVPFPKRLGRPEEFAKLVLHIIENTLLNGEVIRLDGALRMAAK